MSYRYQGIDISAITYTIGGSNATTIHSSYGGFPPINNPTENMSKPYSFGYNYTSNNISVSDSCKASYNDYTNTVATVITVPTGVKHFRSILIGGGGGGGGNGGDAKATANVNGNSSNGNGGNGGTGGSGLYTTTPDISIVTGVNTVNIICGAGGSAGSNGGSNSIAPKDLTKLPDQTKGGDGNTGGGGGVSTIIYNTNTTYSASGGSGGGGGGGATATVTSSSNTNSTSPGPATGYTTTTTTPVNWPALQPTAGVGGVQGINGSAQNATVGQPGAVRIIWLYQ